VEFLPGKRMVEIEKDPVSDNIHNYALPLLVHLQVHSYLRLVLEGILIERLDLLGIAGPERLVSADIDLSLVAHLFFNESLIEAQDDMVAPHTDCHRSVKSLRIMDPSPLCYLFIGGIEDSPCNTASIAELDKVSFLYRHLI
jgi:hypothetical protein